MKEEGLTADIIIYNNLLACVAEDCLVLEAWAIVEDMTSMGVAPDRHTFNHLIYVRSSFLATPTYLIILLLNPGISSAAVVNYVGDPGKNGGYRCPS